MHFKFDSIRRAATIAAVLMLASMVFLCSSTAKTLPHPSEILVQHNRLLSRPLQTGGALVTILKPGESLRRNISGSETHTLSFALLREQYAQAVFEWQGMDLDVQVRGPNESGFKPSNFHVRGFGSLPVSLIAGADGDYSLVVRPTENANIKGRYEVVLKIVRPPEAIDQKRVDATSLTVEAERESSQDVATEKLRQALQLWTEIGDRHGITHTLQLLGRKYLLSSQASSTNKPDEVALSTGEEFYRRSIEVVQNGDSLEFAYTLLDIGSDFEKFTSPKKALFYYHKALSTFRDAGNRHGEATALFSIGLAEARIGNHREALKWFEPALAINRAESDRLGEARTLNAIGGMWNVLADQEVALSFYQQAESIFNELNDSYRQAITIKNIGVIYDDWGDLQTAKDKYLESLSLLKLHLTTKDLDSCKIKIASEDMSICRSIANTLDNVGELYSTLGESHLALNTLRDGLSIREILKQPQGIGATLSRIAYAHLLQNEPLEALKYCGLAIPFSEGAKDYRKMGSILTFVGMGKAALNQPDEALEYYRQAMMIWDKETEDPRGRAITLDQIGRAYALKNDPERALESYKSALGIWQRIRDQEWEPRTIYNLASTEQNRGNLAGAQQLIESAIQIVESRRGTLSSLQLRTSYFANKEDIYKLDVDLKMQMGKRANNDKYVAAALETSDKARARTLVDTLSEANFSRKMVYSSNALADPRLAKLEARKQRLQGQINSRSQSQRNLLSGKHTREQAEAIDKEISELANEHDALMGQITAINPRYSTLIKPAPLTAGEIQQQLDDNTLLLEYALGEKRSFVWVVSSNSIRGVELSPRDKIEKVARLVIEGLTVRSHEAKNESLPQKQLRIDKAEGQYAEASEALSKMVLEPIGAMLGRKRLVVVADGALQLVSFSALPVPRGSVDSTRARAGPKTAATKLDKNRFTPMIAEHEIVYLPSASVLALQRRELANRTPAAHGVLILADPVFTADDQRVLRAKDAQTGNAALARKAQTALTSPTIPADQGRNAHDGLSSALRDLGLNQLAWLPFSRKEADDIVAVVPKGEALQRLGFKASRETAMSPELTQYQIIHIASHGILNLEHPELSGIVLSMFNEKGEPQDGYVRLYDIYNLNIPAELVVLSACQTGVGKQIRGEGLIALTRGFMYAGAKSVVASLWKVDDKATSVLMAEFYKQMFVNKLKPAAALREAQRKMSESRRWQEPRHWAGFFIQGEWN